MKKRIRSAGTAKKRIHGRFRSLLEYREANELSQRDAARLFGVSQAVWSLWERRQQRPHPRNLERLINGTGVPLEVLMGLES